MSASKKHRSTKNTGKTSKSSGKSNLPLLVVGGGILLLALAAGYIFFASQTPKTGAAVEVSGAPAIKVDQERIDFGDVKVDTPITAAFEIANVGDQPLRFSKVPIVEVVEGC